MARFLTDTEAAKPLKTDFEGVYIRSVSADIVKEFVAMAAEVAPQLEAMAPNEDDDPATAAELMGKGFDMAIDLAWYLFDHALVDEDGNRFEDVKSRDDVAGLDIFRLRKLIMSFQTAVLDAGKS